MNKKFVILGAGPTGLGAAVRLKELGYKNFLILEKENFIGGLSASFRDSHGFTWDTGGHVIHSHFSYFNEVLKKNLKKERYSHRRESWIWSHDRLIPYPFQNNIHLLPLPVFIECFLGLLKQKNTPRPRNFLDLINKSFGEGIAKYFMVPYNEKMWQFPPSKMSTNWLGERVSTIKIGEVLKNAFSRKRHSDWGLNSRFTYPSRGTGQLWENIARQIDSGHIRLKSRVKKIDTGKKMIYLENAPSIGFDFLVSSTPLDQLILGLDQKPNWLEKETEKLAHNSVFFLGVGIKKKLKNKKCWIYFPQKEVPFYRLTYLSNYSPHMTPGPEFYSILTETTVEREINSQKIIEGLLKTKMVENKEKIVDIWTKKAEYAYPIPTLERDSVLKKIQPYLESQLIFSRGRFGAWKYEIGNMDHSFMQGVEIIDRILFDKKETVWIL